MNIVYICALAITLTTSCLGSFHPHRDPRQRRNRLPLSGFLLLVADKKKKKDTNSEKSKKDE